MPSYSNNYSKWDALEVSDDSDIEGHPNVDKKSLIRWKQRDIHEKREARKQRIADFQNEIKSNGVLLPRLNKIVKDLEGQDPSFYNNLVEQLRTQGSPDAPTDLPNQPTYDQMIESLLTTVSSEVNEKGDNAKGDKLVPALIKQLQLHIDQLTKRNNEAQAQLQEELKEQAKHITSEDLKEGFESKYVPPKEIPAQPAIKPKEQKKGTTIEVLNPDTSSSSSTGASSKVAATDANDDEDEDEEVDDEDLPVITPSLLEFSKIPYKAFDKAWEFVQRDRSVFVEGASDALLLQAFNAESSGDTKYAKQCVCQSLMIQYCEKLGRDGVSLFFKRMITSTDPRPLNLFLKDVEDTYALLKKRAKIAAEEQAKSEGVEQIQLVAENPETVISFDVPDGPPPEHIVLEGPGTEDLDPEEVRRTLQTRWEIFDSFDSKFKDALISNKLENVNKVLGKMSVSEAEQIVELLQIAGILHFAEGGIRDETGRDQDEEGAA